MRWTAAALGVALASLLSTAAGAQANLLKNAGFEVYRGGLPVDWESFVMPQEGALADLDRGRACQGRNSTFLYTPQPYEKEPYNNWNQNVLGDFAAETLVLRGAIRTEEAGEACLWLQCWRKNPWSVLATASTAAATPVSGTQNWTRVEVSLRVPAGTDYVTVRCVLEGTGKAWFDDLSLVEGAVSEKGDAPEAPPKAASAVVRPTPPLPPAPVVTEAAVPEPPTAQDPKAIRELMNANKVLMESYQALRETNEALGKQVQSLEREISSLRRQLNQQQPPREKKAEPTAPKPKAVEAPPAPVAKPMALPAIPEQKRPPLVPSAPKQEGEI